MPTALITGASSGIGLELAHLFAAGGYDLALVARNGSRLTAACDTLRRNYDVGIHAIAIDLAWPDAPQQIAMALDGFDVECLINNAGVGLCGEFRRNDYSSIAAMLCVNVIALTALTKLFLPGMRRRGSGRILNVASVAGFLPGPFMAVYYASKAYVLSFSEAIAEELKGSGVTVTTLCPGRTATSFDATAGIPNTRFVTLIRSMRSRDVATIAYIAMMRGRRLVIPGLLNQLLAATARFMPRTLLTFITRRLQGRLSP